MKLLVFTRILRDGGTERVIAQLSRIWGRLGCEVIFATIQEKQHGEFEYDCVHRYQFDFAGATEREFRCFLETVSPDVCMYNDAWNLNSFCRQANIISDVGCRLICLNHHAFSNWAFYLNNAADFEKDELRGIIDALICVNPVQSAWWHTRGFRTVFIPNPVSIQHKEACNYVHRSQMIWVGRPRDIGKRLPVMIEAYRLIKKSVEDARLLIVGDIALYQKKEIEKELTAAERDGIEWRGYVFAIREIFESGGVHVMTSNLEVTSPQVLLEAAVCGIPTVMFELPVCHDATPEHGVIQVATMSGFVKEVCRLFEDGVRAVELSGRAYAWGLSWNQRDLAAYWKDLFAAVISNNESYFECAKHKYLTPVYLELALKEVCRAESFFVLHYFRVLRSYQTRCQWLGILKRKLLLFWGR